MAGKANAHAYLAGVEPYEIAELGGLPMRGVLAILGQPED